MSGSEKNGLIDAQIPTVKSNSGNPPKVEALQEEVPQIWQNLQVYPAPCSPA